MAYTGYKIIQYIDENPNSPTYGDTWEERVLDTANCPENEGEWVLISEECEADTSGFTGNRIDTYYNSATDEYSSTTVSDSSCTPSTTEEVWVDYGEVYCEENDDGTYTGWGIQEQVQRNPNLLNYGDVRQERVECEPCEEEVEPSWQTISTTCHIVADELTCYLTYDGTADLLQIDNNPSSPTFNQTRVISGESEECICEACDTVEYSWVFVDDICGSMMPTRYGLTGLTDDTIYHVYEQYGTCIHGGQSGTTKPTNVYSAVTYQTGVTECLYRWVDVPIEDDYICDDCNVPFEGKFMATYSGGTTYSAECDSSTSLTTADTRPSGYEYSAMTEAVIGDCITSIGLSAFNGCSGLTTCTIGSGVTSIKNNAFYNCYSLSSVTIPDSVTSIGNYAFYVCSGLTSVTIGSGVTSIGERAFIYCFSLTGITCNATTPPSLGITAFISTNDCPIYVPAESVTAYQENSSWSTYSSRIQAIT